jgi:outer membrane autotransporter protein
MGAEQSAIKQLAPTQLTPQVATTNLGVNQTIDVIGQHQELLLSQNGKRTVGRAAGSEYQNGVFWGQVSGGIANRSSDAASDGYSQNYYGLTFGSDIHIDKDTTAGLAFGWVRSNAIGLDSSVGDQVTVNDFQLTAYGTKRFDQAFVNGMLGIGYNAYNQSRDITFLGETAHASYNGLQYMGRVDGGYDFPVDDFTLTPLAGIQAVITDNHGYTESGAGAADISVGSQAFDTFTTTLGGT